MSKNDKPGGITQSEVAEAGVETRFKALTERVAKTADSELKEFLAEILKATETTLSDMRSMRERLDNAHAKADAAAAAAESARNDASDTLLKADIRAEAQAAGAVDSGDVLAFIRVSDVKFGDDGKSNIVELINALKKAKPHLFGRVSTSAAYSAPKPGNASPKNALEMSPGEYRTAKTRFTKR